MSARTCRSGPGPEAAQARGVRRLILLGVALLPAWEAAAQGPVRWCVNEVASPPWRLSQPDKPRHGEKGPQAQGLEYDFLRLLASASGLRFEWTLQPWRRCLLETERGENDAVMSMSHRPERELQFRFPLRDGRPDPQRALMRLRYHLYGARGTAAPWNGQRWQLPADEMVAAPQGYSVAALLREQGVAVDESVRLTEDLLAQLVEGRLAWAALPLDEVEGVLSRQGAWRERLQRVEPPLQIKDYFVVFSHAFVQRHPEWAERIWKAVPRVRQSQAYRKALRAAGR